MKKTYRFLSDTNRTLFVSVLETLGASLSVDADGSSVSVEGHDVRLDEFALDALAHELGGSPG